MAAGFYWSKEYHSRNLARVLEARLSPAAIGVLYLLRCMAGQAQDAGKVIVDGATARRSSLTAFLRRQFGDGAQGALAELFERGFLETTGRWEHVIVMPWKADQEVTPEAKRKRISRSGERSADGDFDERDVQVMSSDDRSKSRYNFAPLGINDLSAGQSQDSPDRRERERETEKEEYKIREPSDRDARGEIISFPGTGRGFAPPSLPPPGSGLGSSGKAGEESEREKREREREKERQSTESSGVRSEAWRGGGNEGGATVASGDWRTVDVYADPFRAAQLVTGEYNVDACKTWTNFMRDVGRGPFAEAVAEVRQDRSTGRVRNAAALLAHVLNRKRTDAGQAPVHSRRAQA
jgi:hypothetical protein